ncbi:MAG: hypothetical protein Unbinned338contig1000_7 [Prokaryotic dsDNA virus sp.]|nr:MAG: hypothetical protein Unbinned338contig1000_7 [Prokaryotic dsDNA virus sp.]|tara:strand:- start:2140 stop:2355 length:216 start_codon:yes stop_codon:yes gene_type:complete
MTLHTDTPARFADIRSGKLMEHDQTGGQGILVAAVACMVFWIVLIGWFAFDEITRCDPCEWVQFDAPMEGW